MTAAIPTWAKEMLKQAALVPNTEKDPNARVKAVDRVVQHLRSVIPDHFQEDPHEPEDRHERDEPARRAGPLPSQEH